MSDCEKINAGVKLGISVRRKAAIKGIIIELVKVLVAIFVALGLEAIGFVSKVFFVILVAFTICVGAFKTGYIYRDIKF